MTIPKRIQRKRTAGWQMPPDTVSVTRGTIWGNPFSVVPHLKPGTLIAGAHRYVAVPTAEDAVSCFREMLNSEGETAETLRSRMHELRGKNLACWCPLDEPFCHADVLLEIANEVKR